MSWEYPNCGSVGKPRCHTCLHRRGPRTDSATTKHGSTERKYRAAKTPGDRYRAAAPAIKTAEARVHKKACGCACHLSRQRPADDGYALTDTTLTELSGPPAPEQGE